MLVIFMTITIDMIGFGIILPLLPLYARRFSQSEAMVVTARKGERTVHIAYKTLPRLNRSVRASTGCPCA